MRAGNTEIAARKPTASPCISNGGDILPDRTSVHPSRNAGPRQPKIGRDAARHRPSLQAGTSTIGCRVRSSAASPLSSLRPQASMDAAGKDGTIKHVMSGVKSARAA